MYVSIDVTMPVGAGSPGSSNTAPDSAKTPPSPPDRPLIWVEWQTWPFNVALSPPRIGWSVGICELEDFLLYIKPALKTAGQTPYWREISITEK